MAMTDRIEMPIRHVLTILAGLAAVVIGFNLLPHDPTDELPAVSTPPRPLVVGLAKTPAPNTTRIFVVGASLSSGYPYLPSAAYGGLLGVGLDGLWKGRRVEARAIALPALDSPLLADMVEQLVEYKPSVICVSLGSNEFANRIFSGQTLDPESVVGILRDRLSRARKLFLGLPKSNPQKDEARFQQTLLDKAISADRGKPAFGGLPLRESERKLLIGRMRRSMRRIDRVCRANDVELVFLVAVYGEGGFWPFGISAGGIDSRVDELVRASWRALDPALLPRVDGLLAEMPERADLHFLRGRLLRAAGKIDEARTAFERARDLDTVPIHLTGPIQDAILGEAKALGRASFRLDAAFEALSADGIAGPEHYLDYGHLSLKGHAIAARYVAERLGELGLLPGELPDGWRESFDSAVDGYLAKKMRERLFAEKFKAAHGDISTSDGVFNLLFGNFREGLACFKQAFVANPADGQRGINLIYCLYTLAERRDELVRGNPKERELRFATLYQDLLAALANGKLDEKIERVLDGKD